MGNLLGDLASKIIGQATGGIPDDTVRLSVNGKQFEGWQSVTVKRSIKAISGVFDLSVIQKWGDEMVAWQIVPGDECKLTIGTETLITGYVDDVSPRFDAETRTLSVTGRDTSSDIVDCSVDLVPAVWTNISLKRLVEKVADDFDVGVTVDPSAAVVSVIPFVVWKVNQGESAFETIDRAAKMRGVLLTNDGDGNIVITRAGTSRAASELIQGSNILSCEARFSMKDRFSKYTVKAQDGGLDGIDPAISFKLKSVVKDTEVNRYRPLVVVAEGAYSQAICKQRAKWESAVRRGKSTTINVTVVGWRQSDGSLWEPNQICKLSAPGVAQDIDLLITEVTLKKSDGGTLTNLRLEPSTAYDPDPTLLARKENLRQLVLEESKRK